MSIYFLAKLFTSVVVLVVISFCIYFFFIGLENDGIVDAPTMLGLGPFIGILVILFIKLWRR